MAQVRVKDMKTHKKSCFNTKSLQFVLDAVTPSLTLSAVFLISSICGQYVSFIGYFVFCLSFFLPSKGKYDTLRRILHIKQEYRWMEMTFDMHYVLTEYSFFSPCPPLLPPPRHHHHHLYNATVTVSRHACIYEINTY